MANCNEINTIMSNNIARTLTISTANGGKFVVEDTDECPVASMALAQFMRGGVMQFNVDGEEYLVPASAVDNIKVEYASDSE